MTLLEFIEPIRGRILIQVGFLRFWFCSEEHEWELSDRRQGNDWRLWLGADTEKAFEQFHLYEEQHRER